MKKYFDSQELHIDRAFECSILIELPADTSSRLMTSPVTQKPDDIRRLDQACPQGRLLVDSHGRQIAFL